MRIKLPEPFLFEAGKRAVLLLHGFTGHSADVRMLGRFLEKKGYTTHAPQYKGHGVPPEELVQSTPEEWWQDVLDAYQLLKDKGYEEIAVAGLSMGGVFSLKLGYTLPVKGIITMCTPVNVKSEEVMFKTMLKYIKEFKQLQGKSKEEVDQEMETIRDPALRTLRAAHEIFGEIHEQIRQVEAPLLVVQAEKDQLIDINSANKIYESVSSTIKDLKWYEKSGHVITIGPEKEQLYEDIFEFLEQLNWSV